MKKVLFVITAVLMLAMSAVPASAGGGLTEQELETIPDVKLLETDEAATLTAKVHLPEEIDVKYQWYEIVKQEDEDVMSIIKGATNASYTPEKTVGTRRYMVTVMDGTEWLGDSNLISVTYEAHTHKYGEWVIVTESTCTKEGSCYRKCSCGARENGVIAKADHNWNAGVTQRGEDGDVVWTYTCKDCHTKKTEVQEIVDIDDLTSSEPEIQVTDSSVPSYSSSTPSATVNTQPDDEEEGGFPWWIIIVVSVVVVGAGVAVTVIFFMNKD